VLGQPPAHARQLVQRARIEGVARRHRH
jgi:hypothetical protein